MREDDIYFFVKEALTESGVALLAGQPPNGSDHDLPVVEIRDPEVAERGSRGSWKPDLVGVAGDSVVVIECKPLYSAADARKLRELEANFVRRRLLINELHDRGCFARTGSARQFADRLGAIAGMRFCLAYGEPFRPDNGLFALVVDDAGRCKLHRSDGTPAQPESVWKTVLVEGP